MVVLEFLNHESIMTSSPKQITLRVTCLRTALQWIRFMRRPDACKRVVFLSDYDMLLTERLVQGADVWINTPRRLWEASGTSGMKVLVNGGLNLSELDGWWVEAYSPDVGWTLAMNMDMMQPLFLLPDIKNAERRKLPADSARSAEIGRIGSDPSESRVKELQCITTGTSSRRLVDLCANRNW